LAIENSGDPRKYRTSAKQLEWNARKNELFAGLRKYHEHDIIRDVARAEADRIRLLWNRNGRNCTVIGKDGKVLTFDPFRNLPRELFRRPKKPPC
jgi:hypothetical protein